MSIFRIPASTPGAASTTAQMAETAKQLGYTNVQPGYEPAHDGIPATHVVDGIAPAIPDTVGGAR